MLRLYIARAATHRRMALDDWARRVGRACRAAGFGVRTLTGLDTNPVPADWEHVTKVDPEDRKRLPVVYPLYLRHTDAVSVGGSSDVTPANTEATFELLARVPDLPAFHEPSDASHVTGTTVAHSAFLAIPEVLNGDVEALVGTLGEGTEYLTEEMVPAMLAEKLPGWVVRRWGDRLAEFGTWLMLSNAVFEAYVIQNTDSAAAREAGVTEADLLDPPEARRRAMAAEKHLGSEVVYVEYSGTFGGDEAADLLGAIASGLSWSRLWYGGGVDSRESARAVLAAGADTVVVGDVFHDVAAEEQRHAGRALAALGPDADLESVRGWLDEEVDVEASAAARYLSTVPSVPDPVETARTYLARGVHALLSVEALAGEVASRPDPPADGRDLRAALDARGPTPVERYLAAAVGRDGADLARGYVLDWLADRLGVDGGSDLPVSHLAGSADGLARVEQP